MSDVWYLALAYSVIWLGLFAYLVRLRMRVEGLHRAIRILQGLLKGAGGSEAESAVGAALPPEGEALRGGES